MLNSQNVKFPAVVVSGEVKDNRVVFGNFYDPFGKYLEAQFRSIQVKIKRIFTHYDVRNGDVFEISDDELILISIYHLNGKDVIYCTVIQKKFLNEEIKNAVLKITNSGGLYSAERFHHEVENFIITGKISKELDELSLEVLVDLFKKTPVNDNTITEILPFFSILANSDFIEEELLYTKLFQALNIITEEFDIDSLLDPAYIIANHYYSKGNYSKALGLFQKISELTQSSERIILDITSRLNTAQMLREEGGDPQHILDILSTIDDASLEFVTQDDRERYFALQASSFVQLGEQQLAFDFYKMTVMLSEEESSPSIYVAEAREFLGKTASMNYQPQLAAKEFLTAATIAIANSNPELYRKYSHLAAREELILAKYYAIAGIIASVDKEKDKAELKIWKALKTFINSLIHSDRQLRNTEMYESAKEIVRMVTRVCQRNNLEYGLDILSDIKTELNRIIGGSLHKDQEIELLKFLSSKISSMYPLPNPVLIIIGNDGRLLLGGKIGSEWDESVLKDDVIFSGAISAILALFQEVISDKTPLRMIDAGQTQVMIETSDSCIGALLVDRELSIVRQALKDVLEFLEHRYPELGTWEAYNTDLSGSIPAIERFFKDAFAKLQNG